MDITPLYRLVLHPCDVRYAPVSWEPIIEKLREAGFLGASWDDHGDQRFFAGNGFVDCITFMGCSPYIIFEPPENGSLDFCHVKFSEIHADIRFRSASRNVFARCPRCSKRIHEWEAPIAKWREDSSATVIQCDKCNTDVSLYDLGWRHTAGFARVFIDIYSIYPQEGVPTDAFLELLRTTCDTQWHYFYSDR